VFRMTLSSCAGRSASGRAAIGNSLGLYGRPLVVAVAICLSIGSGATVAGAAVDRRAVFTAESPSYFGLWESNSDGSYPTPLSRSTRFVESLSSDGRLVAWDESNRLRVSDVTGLNAHTVFTGPARHIPVDPRFSPENTKLIFGTWYAELVEGRIVLTFTIATVNLDGTGYRTLSNEGTFHATPTYSPDGTRIAYSSPINSNFEPPGERIVIANADGTRPRALTEGEPAMYASEPRFSPDGRSLVFVGWEEGEEEEEVSIFTIDVDGSNLLRVRRMPSYIDRPEWTPDGRLIVYDMEVEGEFELYSITPEGTEARPFLPSEQFEYSGLIAFAQPSTIFDDDAYLGATFEPVLKFDTNEYWRPLNVETFLEERKPEEPEDSYNEMCTGNLGCYGLSTEWRGTLREAYFGTEAPWYIKMGRRPEFEEEYEFLYPTSPHESCLSFPLVVDCTAGPRTAMYYHVAPSASANERTEGGYNYVDYWAFYRYNNSPGEPEIRIGDHEGDWEGVTVAPSTRNPRAFDVAIFAQHGGNAVYPAANLTCDSGGAESCQESEEPIGQRVWDYVAAGTHAAYPNPDDGGRLRICLQDESIVPEGCHDGAYSWGANNEPANLLKFPPALGWEEGTSETATWVDWPGQWGGSESSPDSPGTQGRFTCPWDDSPLDEATACPSQSHRPRVSPAKAHNAVVSRCASWFGAGVAIAACSPRELRRAVKNGALHAGGRLRIQMHGKNWKSASVPGAAQTLGPALHPGQRATVSGQAPSNAQLLVRAQQGNRIVAAAFTQLGLERGGRGRLLIGSKSGQPTLTWRSPNGQRINPSSTHATRVPSRRALSKTNAPRAGKQRLFHRRPAAGSSIEPRRQDACTRAQLRRLLSEIIDEQRQRHRNHRHTYRPNGATRTHC
jgi:Tol biopolymer transport system component